MNETKRIIVEFGARRQQFILTDHRVSTSALRYLIGNHFDIEFDNNSIYTLQMYNNISHEYNSLDDDQQIFDTIKDIVPFHRFRIIKKSLQLQKYHLIKNLQSTVDKLHSATNDIDKIQNLFGTLNQNCDVLNQLMDIHGLKSSSDQSTYLLDPSTMKKDIDLIKPIDDQDDEEIFESVSCYDTIPPVNIDYTPAPIPSVINVNKPASLTTDNNIQTRIIPCKYAVRGTCHHGDKCLYLHDETCIQSAREWERRFHRGNMFPILTTFQHNEENKENYDFSSKKSVDEDIEIIHDDCLIIEPDIPIPIFHDTNSHISLVGILPNDLSKQTKLFLIYENRIMNVHVVTSVNNLERHHHITISHVNHFYSIPKRHLYLSNICDIQHISIPQQYRIMYISPLKKQFSLGFICENPSVYNNLRHLILFDDGSVAYTTMNDHIHVCLCQDFERNFRSIESKLVRKDFQELFFDKNLNKKQYQLHNYVRVKKFDDKYHNAQIIDIDCSIIKLKFYERQAQTEIWMHRQSSLIDDIFLSPIEIASPIILQNKRKHDEISTLIENCIGSTNNNNICNGIEYRCATSDGKRRPGRPRKNHLPPSETRVSPLPSIHTFHSNSYQLHQCSSYCVLGKEENFNPNCFTENPYTLPFSCGWKYFHINRYAKGRFTKKPSTHKTTTSRSNYLYRSPCGRSFLTLDEVETYLFETNSKLTIKFFIDNLSTHIESFIEYDSKYILNDDISQGKESVKISVYNDNNNNLPDSFLYGTETRSKLILRNDPNPITCCSCTDNCRDRLKCPCWRKTFEQAKSNDNEQIVSWQRQHLSDEQMISRFGYVHQRLKAPVWSGIYECNSKCSCHTKQCTNRVVQNSLYQQIQLFHTDTKGWALRALHDIPHGSFMNAYVGELITEEMATKRDFKYLAILDHTSHLYTNDNNKRKQSMKNCFNYNRIIDETNQIPIKRCVRLSTDSISDEDDNDDDDGDSDDEENHSCFILDAKYYGSISRFYNHSCKPNIHIQNVFINSHDPQFPVIALFACRNIRAGEEICWDYNYTVGCMSGVRIDCQCQASNCRGRLL
ncbi:unnamed protein product [Adineta steineri]|uniref:Uncharacterized protein n=1 Tax=Adineta steineri TaxID=433720 RepID=A0A818Q374_9BILA|nr:unnamed protein product [Adineta steineri]